MNDASVRTGLSTIADGSMSAGVTGETLRRNKTAFLNRHDMSIGRTILVALSYESEDFRRYRSVTIDQAGDGMTRPSSLISDALFTDVPGLALFLPIADCIGAVLYDPVHRILGLAHLGRHNLVQSGGVGSIRYMADTFGSDPADVEVWLSPAAGKDRYPLYDFAGRSLHEVATDQLISAGVATARLQVDSRDTTKERDLYSHSEYLRGARSSDGRQAVVAMMRP